MDKLKSAEQLTVQNAVTTETGTGRIIRPEKFFPSGAIAFFIALVILCLVIWFGIYFLMIERI